MQSDLTTAALLLSYLETGGAGRAAGPGLPSRHALQEIIEDYFDLVFPGFHGKRRPAEVELAAHTGTVVRNLAARLGDFITRCFFAAGNHDAAGNAQRICDGVLRELPALRVTLASDVDAAYRGDPSAFSTDEIILSYPGLYAIAVQRFAHLLYQQRVPLLPRMLTEYAHEKTGCDLHPGARIGLGFFIDHGTGTVVGETATIGNGVRLYQGVTIGARSFAKDAEGRLIRGTKRHPDIEDDVVIYAHATILGGDTRIGRGSIIGSNVWLMRSLPPRSVAYITGDHVVVRPRESEDSGVDWFI